MPGPGRFTWKCLFMKRNLAALQLYLKVDFEGFFIVFTHCVSLLTRWRHIFKKKKMTLFKYGTKLAFKKMGFIFLPPFHLSSPHSLFKTIFSLIIILNFLMGVSSEKIFVRPKSFWEKMSVALLEGRVSSLERHLTSSSCWEVATVWCYCCLLLGCRGQCQKVTLPPWAPAL